MAAAAMPVTIDIVEATTVLGSPCVTSDPPPQPPSTKESATETVAARRRGLRERFMQMV
jgi:hypothetical protein